MSSFFASSGGAGPLDWPKGSKLEPENTDKCCMHEGYYNSLQSFCRAEKLTF